MRSATGDSADARGFVIGRCPECRREVLTYPGEAYPGAGETRRCVHCDETVDGTLRWIDDADLEAFGYVVDSGAKRGCASCASGGCAVRPVNGRGGAR